MTTSDLARRTAVQDSILRELPAIQRRLAYSTSPDKHMTVLVEAVGDLAAARNGSCGDWREWALIGACVQGRMEELLALEARCVCPVMPGVGSEDRCISPLCAVHGEGSE